MARTGITQEQVYDTANRLVAGQQSVTVQSVREALGAGSFTTIGGHLRHWHEQALSEVNLAPPPVLEPLARHALQTLWQAAAQISRAEIEQVRRLAHTQVEDQQQHNEVALQEITRLEKQAELASSHAADQAMQLHTLQEILVQAQATIAAQGARSEQLTLRVEELRTELLAARTSTEQKSEECGHLRGELAAAMASQKPLSPKPNGRAITTQS